MKRTSAGKKKLTKIVSRGKKKVKRKLKRTRNKVIRRIAFSAFLLGAGTCIGLYHEDIMRWYRKMKLDKKLADLKENITGRR